MPFDLVDQKPVWLNVAFAIAAIIPGQGMIAVLGGKRLLAGEKVENGLKGLWVAAAFDCFGVVFFEVFLIVDVKHSNPSSSLLRCGRGLQGFCDFLRLP